MHSATRCDFAVLIISVQKREQKAKGVCMYVCGAVVILHFTQLDPPKSQAYY